MIAKQKIILYVDDDADDREFLCDAIHKANPEVEVVQAENGLEALDYLNSNKENHNRLPCLIVLDINMPLLDGKETFHCIKNDRVLQALPVIVLSSSEKPADKDLFNNLGVEYFTKPTNISYLSTIASRMVSVCC